MKYFKQRKRGVQFKRLLVVATVACLILSFISVLLWPFGSASAAQVTIDSSVDTVATWKNNNGPDTVFISDQVGYVFYRDSTNQCVYSKTTDAGATWGVAVLVFDNTACLHPVVWYDQWTPGDNTGSLIHILSVEGTGSDLYYNTLDTSGDTLGLAAASNLNISTDMTNTMTSAGQARITITKATNGAIFAGVADGGTVGDTTFVKRCSSSCTATAANWVDTSFDTTKLPNGRDEMLLLPQAGGDILLVGQNTGSSTVLSLGYESSTATWDASALVISNTVQENTSFGGYLSAVVNRSNFTVYASYLDDIGTINAGTDMETAVYAGGNWTAKTSVVTNSATRGMVNGKLALDENTGELYAVYTARTTPGTATTANIYWKKSTDGATTWGAESAAVNTAAGDLQGARVNIMSNDHIYVTWHDPDGANTDKLYGNTIVDLTPVDQVAIDSSITTAASGKLQNGSDIVYISDQVGYSVYSDSTGTCVYSKTTNGGKSWGSAATVDASTNCGTPVVWYDRWTPGDDTGTNIYILSKTTDTNLVNYNVLNTATDTLASGTAPPDISGAYTNTFSTGSNRQFISKGTDGVMWAGIMDGGTVGDTQWIASCSSSCSTASNWVDRTPAGMANAPHPDILLMPLSSGNMLMIQRDVSTDVLNSALFTASTATWGALVTIDAAPTPENTTYRGSIAATVNRKTGAVYLVYPSDNATLGGAGTAADDIRVRKYSGGTWSSGTNVETDSALGITRAAIAVDENTGNLYVAYTGLTTPATATTGNVYYKSTSDDMTTWSTQSSAINNLGAGDLRGLQLNMMSDERLYVNWHDLDGVNPDKLYGRTVVDLVQPQFEQVGYRLFSNANSTDVGSAYAAQNTSAVLPTVGSTFRVRQLLRVSAGPTGGGMLSFKVQYAGKGAGTCAAPSGVPSTYTDVGTGGGQIAYYNNAAPVNGANLTANAGDPTHAPDTVVAQTYVEAQNFTTTALVSMTQVGKWDFSLIAPSDKAPHGTTYCLKIVKADGSLLNSYTNFAEFTTLGPGTADLLRNGGWFSGEVEQSFAL